MTDITPTPLVERSSLNYHNRNRTKLNQIIVDYFVGKIEGQKTKERVSMYVFDFLQAVQYSIALKYLKSFNAYGFRKSETEDFLRI